MKTDVDVLVRGMRLILRIAQQPALQSVMDITTKAHPDLDQSLHEHSDLELEKVVRERAETLYHPVGTTKMAPREDGGVVDAYLRVHGVKGLRVVDASIMPMQVSAHLSAPLYGIAEKAAALISEDA